MFQKCKQNQCLTRQLLDFLSRQLAVLKCVAHAAKKTTAEITCDSIMESVSLIEKKIYFSLGEESTQDFHDYITDFYDDKIRQLRKELNDYMLLCSSLQEQLKDRVRANLSVVEDKTDFDFAPLEEVAALKKALAHSEKIIQQNNILIKEQSTALEEMATFVTAMEKKEKTNLAVYQQKVQDFDCTVSKHLKDHHKFIAEIGDERARTEKSIRELQIHNVSLLEEKGELEGELLFKEQQIKLLAKKVYDQSLLLAKFERELQEQQAYFCQQRSLGAKNNEDYECLKERMVASEKQWQRQMSLKLECIHQLEAKVNDMHKEKREEELTRTMQATIQAKSVGQLNELRVKYQGLEKEVEVAAQRIKELVRSQKKMEKRQKELIETIADSENERQKVVKYWQNEKETVDILKLQLQAAEQRFQQERAAIKNDIEADLKDLVKVNTDSVNKVYQLEEQLKEAQEAKEKQVHKTTAFGESFAKLTASFENAKQMVYSMQKEKLGLQGVISEYEKRVMLLEKQVQGSVEEAAAIAKRLGDMRKLQEQCEQLQKDLDSRDSEVSRCKRILQESTKSNTQTKKEEIQVLKEELSKKDFLVRQLTSKVNILQEQLRDTDHANETEKKQMADKIRELEQIIQERFEMSNRVFEASY